MGTSSIDAENADVVFNGGVDVDRFGDTVGWAGDVNGDGYDDVLVAADQAEYTDATCTTVNCGVVYIFLGPLAGTSSIDAENADILFGGENNSEAFGMHVAGGGDTNADGYADVLVAMEGGEDVGGSCAAWQDCGQAFLITSFEAYLGERNGSNVDIGRIGQGLSFNGTSDSVSVGDMTSAGVTHSVSFWLKADDITTRDVIQIRNTIKIDIDGSSQITGTNWLSPTYYVDGVSGARTIDEDWHHVVVTTNVALTTDVVTLGYAGSNYFDGMLDEIRFYDYELSEEEVRNLYLQGK